MLLPMTAAALVASTPALVASEAEALQPGTRAMIEAAIAGGDPKAVEIVLGLARQTNPEAAEEIDRIGEGFRADLSAREAAEARAAQERLASASMFDAWKGEVELGATRSTGTTDSLGFFAAASGTREGIKWRHKFAARADIQETNDVTTTERILVSWQPNLKFADRFYAYGIAQFEYDPLLGYDSRYTLGGGLGHAVLAREGLRLDVEGGPVVRVTDPVDAARRADVAGRASLDLAWAITPTLSFKQTGAFYYQPGETSGTTLSALEATLIGDLKARLSYNVQYEKDAPPGTSSVDTTSRATLIYSF